MTLRLTGRRRTVMLLKCRDGLTHKGIAYRLGIGVETVRTHISEAKRDTEFETTEELCWALAQEADEEDEPCTSGSAQSC